MIETLMSLDETKAYTVGIIGIVGALLVTVWELRRYKIARLERRIEELEQELELKKERV